MRSYFQKLQDGVESSYRVARAARAKGFDPELDVEIPLTDDLASRVERLLHEYDVEGVAQRIRELAKHHDREELAILVAKEMARRPAPSKEKAVDRAVRVGLAILTEGILVAPLEGLAGVKVKKNRDGSSYVDLFYAGPIRSAGGTGQALSVLIADVVRRELALGKYQPTREEVERFKEEIPLYKQAQHLQYTPTDEEITLIVSNCPVGLNGEGTEEAEISGYRDLPRIETNRIRGGACLVIADGMCLKAPKIQKHVKKLKIDGWEFIDAYLTGKATHPEETKDDIGVEPSEKFIQNIVAGRPVLCHPSRAGGLRLRYGRTRATGLAALAMHPATMHILDDFIAIGTQVKTERPGKAGAITACDAIEGPLVVLKSGDFVEVNDAATAKRLAPDVRVIADLGEILVPFGEFLENNHVLMPGAFSLEWYGQLLQEKVLSLPEGWRVAEAAQALDWSRRLGIPLHPRHNLFWHDLTVEELRQLRTFVAAHAAWSGDRLSLPPDEDIRELLVRLGAPFQLQGDRVVLERHTEAFLACLGIRRSGDACVLSEETAVTEPLAYVSALAGFPVKARGPTRIGARMARPEKAAPRKMQPAPHSLFPIGHDGGAQRLVSEAIGKDAIEVEVGLRVCERCGKRWFLPGCSCGGHTVPRGLPARQKIPLPEVLRMALERLGEPKAPEIKAVMGMISKTKTPEPLEKGILRAKHEIFVFKDGTTRYDMTNLPLTHFMPAEAGIRVELARRLGYERDIHGQPLEREDQVLELRTQDILIADSCGEYLLRVAAFIDELLEKYYGLPRFYNAATVEDLLGQLVVTLAPHTSAGVLARIVGFTKAQACFAHPYMIAARRRNCDGDEDSLILLLDSLINFSRSFLPDKRGGLMDAPLVLTMRIDPNEIDKEAHNLDLAPAYPVALYQAAERFAHPKEIEHAIDTVSKRIG
ncbi:MAG TPA: DNA polymerase II large subunit, partial [Thermoplasmata archaeon]|nr:DNA polymerase II large subunit [Thermoplasmata archaeon]